MVYVYESGAWVLKTIVDDYTLTISYPPFNATDLSLEIIAFY